MDYHQILYIEPLDEVAQVKEKMAKTKKEKVILVLPAENKKLKNIENLTSLKIEAQKLGKKLTIFSSDPPYQKLAEECGIEIEKSLIEDSFLAKQEISFRPKIRDIFPKKELEEITAEKTKAEKEIEKKPPLLKEPTPKKSKLLLNLLYTLFVISLIGGIIFCFYYLPKAEITLVPVSEEIEFASQFTVKKGTEIDLKGKLLPGTLLIKDKEVEKSFLSTGSEKRVDKATGKITVYNEDNSPHNFVPNTRFQTSDGKIFRQPQGSDWVSVPAGSKDNPGKVEIKVVADEAGEEYNIGPTKFTLPGLKGTAFFEKVYGKSKEAMKGGFIGEAKVVAKEDVVKATQEMQRLQENLAGEVKNDILKEIPPSLQFLKDSVITTKEKISFDKKVGEIGETFKGKAKVSTHLLKFNEEDVQKIIANIILDRVKEGIEFEEVVSSLEVNYEVVESKIEKCTNVGEEICEMEIKFTGKEKVAWKVTADDVKKAILGEDEQSFEKYIKEDMKGKIERAELKLWPFWVNKIPQKENRVFIQVKYE